LFELRVFIERDRIRFLVSDTSELEGVSCDKVKSIGEYIECVKRINVPKFMGLRKFIMSIPWKNVDEIKVNGLHTKIYLRNQLLDYFEVGAPIRMQLMINIILRRRRSGSDLLKVYVPFNHVNQKNLGIEANFPYYTEFDGDNYSFLIEIPPSHRQREVNVAILTKLELRGFNLLNDKKIVNSKIRLKLQNDGALDPKLLKILDRLKDSDTIFNLLKNMFNFLEENIRYRLNVDRFGGMYAFKMGFGACDEISELVVIILNKLGIKAKFVRGLYIKENLNIHGHAWVELKKENKSLPFDPTAKMFGIGRQWIRLMSEKSRKDKIVEIGDKFFVKGIKFNII